MKRAIHLINHLRYGGAENVACNYIKVLSKIGITSVLIGKSYSNEFEEKAQAISSVKNTLSISDLNEISYVFIHSNQSLLRLLPFYFILKKRNIRTIYIQHLCYKPFKFSILSKLINFLCTDFIQITPITQKLVDRCIRIRTHFIVNFYLNKYLQTEWDVVRSSIRQKLNISEDKIVVTFSAVFKPGKNIGDFIKLAKSLQNNSRYFFLVIGDGPESRYVKAYNGSNILWVGLVSNVEEYLIASDIYAFMSKFKLEMMPMALIEAINTNKKILAYKTDINDFLLSDNTFTHINKNTLQYETLPSGKDLKHYNEAYAESELRRMLDS